ncbi:MAG: TetR/AcrR family transcriptional regulator [Myxococcota bacterium]
MTLPQRSGRTKQEIVKSFRTHEILAAARRVIAELGYAEASMDRIAQKAGVAKGTLYLYFKNKDALLERAFEDGLAQLARQARAATRRVRGPRGQLRELARAALEHALQNRAFYQALREHTRSARSPHPLSATRARAQLDRFLDLIEEVLEAGIAGGEFRALDRHRAARFLLDLILGIALERLQSAHAVAVEADVSTILDFYLHGVGAGDPA